MTLLLYILVDRHCGGFVGTTFFLQVILPILQALHTLGLFESITDRCLDFSSGLLGSRRAPDGLVVARICALSLQEAARDLNRLSKLGFSLGLCTEGLAYADLVLPGISGVEGLVLGDYFIWLWMGHPLLLLNVECRMTQVINIGLSCRLGYLQLVRKSLVGDLKRCLAALDRLLKVLLGEVHA